MPLYVTLIRWTDQGREKAASLPERVAEVERRLKDRGVKIIGNWATMGQYDQVAVSEAPDDETAVKWLFEVAGRGNAATETMRAFTMDEVGEILKG